MLNRKGKELRRISLIDALARSPFASLLDNIPNQYKGDYLHPNAVKIIDAKTAAKWPFANQGDLLISLREPGALMIFDPVAKKVRHTFIGPWRYQHDPDILANGNILIFDNHGGGGPQGKSRVIEYDPTTQQIVWQYEGTKAARLESKTRSSQQLLPNGNILITETENGRLLEIDRNGELVWEYFNPARRGKDDEYVGYLRWAERFRSEKLQFEFNGGSN